MKETNKPIREMSTEILKSKITNLEIKTLGLQIFTYTSILLASQQDSLLIARITRFAAGMSIAGFTMTLMKQNKLIDELDYRSDNSEEQPKVYQKEINHTR